MMQHQSYEQNYSLHYQKERLLECGTDFEKGVLGR